MTSIIGVTIFRILFLLQLFIGLFENVHSIDKFVYKSYQNSVYCTASSPILYPTNSKELHQIIRTAIIANQTVKLIGSRHSITDVICTDGIPVSTKHINYTLFDSDCSDTVTVGSGAELKDVLEYLHQFGKTLIHVPAFGGITIGGAIGTGAHGSSLLHPTTISDQVVGVTVIDGVGEIRKISDPTELRAFRFHLGLLGAIVDVTLKTVPLFKMTVYNHPESEAVLFDGSVLEAARLHDWYALWWFPSSKSVVISKGIYFSTSTREEVIQEGNAVTNFIPDVSPAEILSGRESFERAQATKNLQSQYGIEEFTKYSLYREVVGKPPIFTETFQNGSKRFVNPATGYAHRLQSNRCSNKCAWDNGESSSIFPEESAMAFDVNELPKVIAKIKVILEQIPAAFSMIGVFIRFSKASDGLMSIGAERDSVHVEWTTPMRYDPYTQPRDSIGAYQAILQAMVNDHNGRPHWGKNGQVFLTREIIRKRPPKLLKQFQAMMRKYDPNGVFLNKFGKRILLESNELTVDPHVKRLALQDYCICDKHVDCADFQVCTKVNGAFPVCKDMIPAVPGIPGKPFTDYDPLNFTDIVEKLMGESTSQ